jgi:hypothetical protein
MLFTNRIRDKEVKNNVGWVSCFKEIEQIQIENVEKSASDWVLAT